MVIVPEILACQLQMLLEGLAIVPGSAAFILLRFVHTSDISIVIAIVSIVTKVLRPSVNQYNVSTIMSRIHVRLRAFLKIQHSARQETSNLIGLFLAIMLVITSI